MSIPQDVGGKKSALFKEPFKDDQISARMEGYDMVATFAGGQMTVRYDGVMGVTIEGKSGTIFVPGKVGGLCGNLNGRDTDEFTKNSWPPVVTKDFDDFAYSWRVSNYNNCRFPQRARKMCNYVHGGNRKAIICETVFSKLTGCSEEINKAFYKMACAEDSCTINLYMDIWPSNMVTTCSWIKYYAGACRDAGTPITIDYANLGQLQGEILSCPDQCNWFKKIYMATCPINLRDEPDCLTELD